MNRSDLSWALNAALPHVGTTKGPYLGLDVDSGSCWVYATDDYTAGMARIDADTGNLSVHLSKSEATDLMRFIRPNNKTQEVEPVTVVVRDGELHVAIPQTEANTSRPAGDSAVFETVPDAQVTRYVMESLFIQTTAGRPATTVFTANPEYLSKFAKASRNGDSVIFYCYSARAGNRPYIKAVVRVGANFIGAIASLTTDHLPANPLEGILQNRQVAA